MSLLDWNEFLSIHIPEIDAQHRHLVGYVNELYDALQAGRGKAVINEICTGLINYTETHFGQEEALMLKYEYPEYFAHKKEHEGLKQQAAEFYQKYQNDNANAVELFKFLVEWLQNHIVITDKKTGEYLQQKIRVVKKDSGP